MSSVNQWTDNVEPIVLEQYKDSTKWQGVLKASVDQIQVVDDDAQELAGIFEVEENDPPTGYKLDYIAGLINIRRYNGESDESLFERFISARGKYTAGTPDFVIERVQKMQGANGDHEPVFYEHESEPAKFFVYTPDGSQLLQSQVRRLGAAGVLGMVGAALLFEDGNAVGTEEGDIYLVAGIDGNA